MRRSAFLLCLLMPVFSCAKVLDVHMIHNGADVFNEHIIIEDNKYDYVCQRDEYLLNLTIIELSDHSIVRADLYYQGDLVVQPTMSLAVRREGKITIQTRQGKSLELGMRIRD